MLGKSIGHGCDQLSEELRDQGVAGIRDVDLLDMAQIPIPRGRPMLRKAHLLKKGRPKATRNVPPAAGCP